jgi:hypothetical protein
MVLIMNTKAPDWFNPFNTVDVNNYTKTWELAKSGQITQQEWFEYCQSILNKSLDKNKDVLTRLKNR